MSLLSLLTHNLSLGGTVTISLTYNGTAKGISGLRVS